MSDYKEGLLTDNFDDGSWHTDLVDVWDGVVVVGADI